MSDVTTHDIEANGTKYILEWTHDDDGKGHIAITEACDDTPTPCDWFLNDSKPVRRWCCSSHQFEGDETETEQQFAVAPDYDCAFAEGDEFYDDDIHMHETFDFEEMQ